MKLPSSAAALIFNPARPVRIALWVVAGIAVLLFSLRAAWPANNHVTHGLSVYYTSARLTLEGKAGPQFCTQWFGDQQRQFGFGKYLDRFCVFPPTMSLLMLPFAWMDWPTARLAWIAAQILSLAAIAVLAFLSARWVNPSGEHARGDFLYAPLAITLLAFFQPIRWDILAGQAYTFIAFWYAVWVYGYLSRRDWLCGLSLAVLALVKLSGWPVWLFIIFQRRWRVLGCTLVCVLFIVIGTLPLFGVAFWHEFLAYTSSVTANDVSLAVPAYQTLLSVLRQTFVYTEYWSPKPLINMPWIATVGWWCITAMILLITHRFSRPLTHATSLFTTLAVLCIVVPLQVGGEQHHYALLSVVFLILVTLRQHLATLTMANVAVLVLALVLCNTTSYFVYTDSATGIPRAWLAYPRLYGSLLLWAWLLWNAAGFRSTTLKPRPLPV